MRLKDLSKIHTRNNTKRTQNDVYWSSIFHKRHIFLRQNNRNNTLVTMPSCKLVSNLSFSKLCNRNLNSFYNSDIQFVALVSRENFNADNSSHFAVIQSQRRIFNISGLVSKNCP